MEDEPEEDDGPMLSSARASMATPPEYGSMKQRLNAVAFATDESTACTGRRSKSRHTTARISLTHTDGGRSSCKTPPPLGSVGEGDSMFQAPFGGSVSTTDLPPLDDYLERRQQLARQQQLMMSGLVEAVSREIKTSVEACMARLESKLIDDVRQAGAESVAENMAKLTPKLVQAIRKADENAMAKRIALLTSGSKVVGEGCDMMVSQSSCGPMMSRPSTSFTSRMSAAKVKSLMQSESNSGSDRSIKALEQHRADQILEDCGLRHESRSNSRSHSASSGRRRPSEQGSAEHSGAPSLFDLVPAPPADSVAAARPDEMPHLPGIQISEPPEDVQPTVGQVPLSSPRNMLLAMEMGQLNVPDNMAGRLNIPDNMDNGRYQVPPAPREDPYFLQDEAAICQSEGSSPGDTVDLIPVVSISQEIIGGLGKLVPGEDSVVSPSMSQVSMKRKSERMTTTEMRRVRVNELTEGMAASLSKTSMHYPEDSEGDDDEVDWHSSMPVALRVCGIIPWAKSWPRTSSTYQVVVWLVTLAACICIIVRFAYESLDTLDDGAPGVDLFEPLSWSHREAISELPVATGAVVSLAALGLGGYRGSLPDDLALLKAYAVKQEFSGRWGRLVCFDRWFVLSVWILAQAAHTGHILGNSAMSVSAVQVAHLFAFAITSGILLGFVFCMLYVCRALALMVDTFCSRVMDCPDLPTALDEWNVLQAVLRKVSAAIEACFLALQAVMVFTMPLILADFYLLGASRGTLAKLLPSMCATFAVLRMFALAALITDKCTRVPALINSLSFGVGTDRDRQHTVDYIVSSAAGFYVCDVRLNTGMALKFMYGWSVIAFGLITHLFTSD